MLSGYAGKLLRVDLSNGEVRDEPLPDEATLRKFVGGVGLGSKILYDEIGPEVEPLDPENRLLFITGPLGGTSAPGSNNCVVMTLSPDTGYTMSAAHTHSYFGAYLKYAGYDGIVVQGTAKAPVYLWVNRGRAEIRDAAKLWGKDTHETVDLLRGEFAGRDISISAIGPAGENCLHGALVMTDKDHVAAKGGGGTVMGSKMLKAVVVGGGEGIFVNKPKEFLSLTEQWRRKIFRREVIEKDFVQPGRDPRNIGVQRKRFESINVLGLNSGTAAKNLLDPDFALLCWQHWVDEGQQFKTVHKGCFNCSRACGYKTEITSGPFKGYTAVMSSGGENIDAQWMAGLVDTGSVIYMGELHNRLGLDSGLAGAAISMAIECYERGILTKEDTGGLELTWGNVDAAAKLLHQMVRREGLGRILAEGPRRAAELIGGDAPKYAVDIKDMAICMHDWRADWSTLLGQIVSNIGPCWQAYRLAFRTEPDLGYTKPMDPFAPEGKAEGVRKTSIRKLWEDCLGICSHDSGRDTPGILPLVPKVLAALTGWADFSLEEALTLGERVSNLQRMFNIRRGFTPANDLEVSPRLLEAPSTGKARGKSIAPYLRDMILEYYGLMGWDKETGEPLPETLQRLGLETM